VYRLAYDDVVRQPPMYVNIGGRDHDRKGRSCRKSVPQGPDEK
jgi:hypothetical protein